jgi:phosphate-selective porin O/P
MRMTRVWGAIALAAAISAVPWPRAARADPAGAAGPADRPDAPAPAATPLPAAPEPPPPASPRFTWQPFGYLRTQYIAVQEDPGVAFVGRDDGFELQNARIGVRGELDRRIAFVIAFDGALDERTQVNTPQGKLGVGLRDAFADVALAGTLAVRAGLFQAVVDPQALVADTARELVDQPIESRGMRATEGYQTPGLPPGRSLGAAIRLDPEAPAAGATGSGIALGFELAVQNGADEFSSNNDNDKPAVSAAVIARLSRGSWLMAAARYNPRTVGDLPFRQDENDLQGTAGLRLGLGPVALDGGLIVQRTTFPTTGGPSQDAYGGHVQAMVALPVSLPGASPLRVGYRFGLLDPSSLVTTDRVMEHTAGAVLGLPRYRMRVQLQLVHVIEQAARELRNDRAQLAAELVL